MSTGQNNVRTTCAHNVLHVYMIHGRRHYVVKAESVVHRNIPLYSFYCYAGFWSLKLTVK